MADDDLQRLATPEFWDEAYFWAGQRPPLRPDPQLPFDQTLMRAFATWAAPAAGERVIELGCAPAIWLVWLAERFGAAVEGIEYAPKGAAFSRANLAACGIEGTVHEADVFAMEPLERDLVVSLGFIEHFDDLDAVFARHLQFVAPGGRLVIGVPNFLGFNGWLQGRADREYLELHNLDAMRPALYERLAREHGLELVVCRHIGGPDPVIVKADRGVAQKLVLAESRLRRLRVTERVDHRLWSSYLFTVMRRPA
jgi:SAM-dependent methyltransferase